MNALFYLMLGISLFCLLAVGVVVVASHSSALLSARTFTQIVTPQRRDRPAAAKQTGARLLDLIRRGRASLRMTEDPAMVQQFEAAGLQGTIGRDVYFAARFCGPVVLGAVGALVVPAHILGGVCGAGFAYLLPSFVLGRFVRRHRQKVRLAIPDAIDLLVICVDAGLGMDQAMVRVGEELQSSHPAIAHEFNLINRAQRAGTVRLLAWQDMAKRTGVPETEALVNMLMQTERFGTPIARALSSYGDIVRQKRRQRAEELAAKTTIKIIFPLVFFIFPSIFIVLLGPAAIEIMKGMAQAK